jgi:hypothetical protein
MVHVKRECWVDVDLVTAERRARDNLAAGIHEPSTKPALSTKAARWFSDPVFDDVLAEEQAANFKPATRGASAGAGDDDSSDDDTSDDDSSDDDNSDGRQVLEGVGYDSEGDVLPLASVPLSERQKRKEKLRKERDREKLKEDRRKKKDSLFEVVAADDSKVEAAIGSQAKQELEWKKEMIRAGMGKALDDEVSRLRFVYGCVRSCFDGVCYVPRLQLAGFGAPVSGKGSKSALKRQRSDDFEDGDHASGSEGDGDEEQVEDIDPRYLDYDSDTRAEMLALGMQMKRHTTAKALVDARSVCGCFVCLYRCPERNTVHSSGLRPCTATIGTVSTTTTCPIGSRTTRKRTSGRSCRWIRMWWTGSVRSFVTLPRGPLRKWQKPVLARRCEWRRSWTR